MRFPRILNGFSGASSNPAGLLRDLHASIAILKSSMGS